PAERFDIIHQLIFHTDWAPHFLLGLKRPVIWGPIGHHRRIPSHFFAPRGVLERAADVARATAKRGFWRADPFLRRAARNTDIVFYANDDVAPPFARRHRAVRLRPYAASFAATPRESA